MNINAYNFSSFLENRLSEPLPGREAHLKMTPFKNKTPDREFEPKQDSKKSAVLILLNTKLELLFTLRSSNLRNHSGQISFPGGKSDEGESFIQTALRETHEEVGIEKNKIEVIGEMTSLYVPPSNSTIQPVVGIQNQECELKLNHDEVSEAFYVPLNEFTKNERLKYSEKEFKGDKLKFPYWDVHSKVPLWGATAIILSEFLELYDEYRQNYS